ncbi:MAG: S49 family peptidase [Acidimicrobiales bacterium]
MATPSPYPPPGTWGPTPRPERRHLSYPQFLARSVTIAVLAPFVLGALAVVSLLPLIVLAVAIGDSGTVVSSDDRVGATSHVAGNDGATAIVLAVPIEGPIVTGESGDGLFGGGTTSGYETKRLLQRAARDPDVRAVVLEMNTPGGTVAGAAAIADGVAALKAAGKPVFAHVSDISASGGVWAMAPADRIIVDPGALVGSIGVILGPLRQYKGVTAVDDGLFGGGVEVDPARGSIDEVVITAGTSKDLGNPYRPLTTAERASLQTAVDSAYRLFVDHVARNRPKLSTERIRGEVGALIYAADDAVRLGLADSTGSIDDAYGAAADAAGLTRWDVRRPDSGGLFDSLFGVRLPWTQRSAPVPDLASLCGPRLVPLAFTGDLTAVCSARR